MNIISMPISGPVRLSEVISVLAFVDILSSCKSRETSTTVDSCVRPRMRPCWLPTFFKVMEGDSWK